MSNSQNTKHPSVGISSGSLDNLKSSWQDGQTDKVGNYIYNVEYPTVVDLITNPRQHQVSKASSVHYTTDAQDPSSKKITSPGDRNVKNTDATSNVARGSNSL